MRRIAVLAAVLALATGLAATAPARADPPTVFAAASLTDAMEAVGRAYEKKTGTRVRFSFASSSTLARQIEAGAPADIFVSANVAWMDYLAERGLIDGATRREPVSNALVLIAPADANGEAMEAGEISAGDDLAGRLGPDGRLAVGDPAHVPAGIYAEQALRSLGMWEALGPRLARADDVRAGLALVARGEAPLGIVYATDARIDSDEVTVIGRFPADSHAPIAYPFAVVDGEADEEIRTLFDFLTGEEALAIYESFGFRRN